MKKKLFIALWGIFTSLTSWADGCKEASAATAPWSGFKKITEEDLSGTKGVEAEVNDNAAYYNLKDRILPIRSEGINIIRNNDGTSKIILVK